MDKAAHRPTYNLEQKTMSFAQCVHAFVRKFPHHVLNAESIIQLLRSSGSIGANYIEANESLGKKDFIMRIRIALKETKESAYWLRLLDISPSEHQMQIERVQLIEEAESLRRIFGAILKKMIANLR